MKQGKWVPVSKFFVKTLPKDRAFTKLEAVFCLQLDFNNKNQVTIAGYSDQWQWSRRKVMKFFKELGIKILYRKDTAKWQNQKGQIASLARTDSDTDNGQIRFIDFG